MSAVLSPAAAHVYEFVRELRQESAHALRNALRDAERYLWDNVEVDIEFALGRLRLAAEVATAADMMFTPLPVPATAPKPQAPGAQAGATVSYSKDEVNAAYELFLRGLMGKLKSDPTSPQAG